MVRNFYDYLVNKASRVFKDIEPQNRIKSFSSALLQYWLSGSKQEGGGYLHSIPTSLIIDCGKHKQTHIEGMKPSLNNGERGIVPVCKVVTWKRGSKKEKSGEVAKRKSRKGKQTKYCGY